MSSRLPDFLIIGAAKAGTTSLYAYLEQHPNIFMSPIKETNYFAYQGKNTKNFLGKRAQTYFPIRTISEYVELFQRATKNQTLGEASPIYLESPIAAKRISETLPEASIVVILRNPVDRAFAGYMMAVRHGRQKPSDITDALGPSSHFVQAGYYYNKLQRYYQRFPRKHIKILLLDDLKQDGLAALSELYAFLGVNHSFRPRIEKKHNVGNGLPNSYFISKIMGRLRKISNRSSFYGVLPDSVKQVSRWIARRNEGKMIDLPTHLKQRLTHLYHEDILRTQHLVQRDLSDWLSV